MAEKGDTGKGSKAVKAQERGKLSSDDRHLWQHVSSTVKPIHVNRYTSFSELIAEGEKKPQIQAPYAQAKGRKRKGVRLDRPDAFSVKSTTPPSALHQALEDISKRSPVAGLDRNSSERLRRGKMPIEGRVDLHGYTRKEAHSRLKSFIHSAYRSGKRCVLVITGKGSSIRQTDDAPYMGGGRKGVLREEVPRWLREPELNRLVIDFKPAQPHHGGAGALYVLLRRARG
ncbi:Smr/MutS family protein [Sneathiella glossodoripedis]|uniref:Smr/MutS family protein n=1 Tax=Sneathiella glossodoripedis TaxID=418853 RepID=UPI000470170A|nr:Smr/MutS family protein [Sneathiella glossodoripedis]